MLISLRTLHILATGILLGGYVFGQPAGALRSWHAASVLTGSLMLALELHATFAVLCAGHGLMTLAKLALLAAMPLAPCAAVALLVGATVLGGVGSHMPGRLRHHMIFLRGRVVPDEKKG